MPHLCGTADKPGEYWRLPLALNPAMRDDPDGCCAVAGNQTGYLVQRQTSNHFPIHLENLIPNPQKPGVNAVS